MKQISWSPRAFVFKGLLSDEECDYLINNVSTGVSCQGIFWYSLLCPLMSKQIPRSIRFSALVAGWTSYVPVWEGVLLSCSSEQSAASRHAPAQCAGARAHDEEHRGGQRHGRQRGQRRAHLDRLLLLARPGRGEDCILWFLRSAVRRGISRHAHLGGCGQHCCQVALSNLLECSTLRSVCDICR